MPLYFCGSDSISTTVPTGSSCGSAAAMPRWTGTPEAVTMPLQYAVALNETRVPGTGRANVSWSVASRAAYFESSAVTSKNDTKPIAATVVTMAFRQKRPEMIMSQSETEQ